MATTQQLPGFTIPAGEEQVILDGYAPGAGFHQFDIALDMRNLAPADAPVRLRIYRSEDVGATYQFEQESQLNGPWIDNHHGGVTNNINEFGYSLPTLATGPVLTTADTRFRITTTASVAVAVPNKSSTVGAL
jgi:hypothetical protein